MIKIVTDSTALLSPEDVQKYNITVIPLNVVIGNQVYKDGETIDGQKLNDYIVNNPDKAFPTTSQPAVGDFVQAYDELTKDGSDVISIHMTDLLSGTAQSALQASRISEGNVTVINSKTTDQGLGHEVVTAAKMAQTGAVSVQDIVDKVHDLMNHQQLFIAVSTLQNLVRGGRISTVTGVISRLFNLHVVLQLTDTELKSLAKGRGKKTLKKWAQTYVNSLKGEDVAYIGLSYTGSEEYPAFVRDLFQSAFPNVPVVMKYTSSIVDVHVGDGACGIIVFTK